MYIPKTIIYSFLAMIGFWVSILITVNNEDNLLVYTGPVYLITALIGFILSVFLGKVGWLFGFIITIFILIIEELSPLFEKLNEINQNFLKRFEIFTDKGIVLTGTHIIFITLFLVFYFLLLILFKLNILLISSIVVVLFIYPSMLVLYFLEKRK